MSQDTTPPIVSSIEPQAIEAEGSIGKLLSSIRLEFSKQLNPIDAVATANYQLQKAGPNGQFDGSGAFNVALTPMYLAESAEVRLGFDPAVLPAGNYRLRVSPGGTLRDSAGNSLDGDSDGAAGGAFERFFVVRSPGITIAPVIGLSTNEAGGIAQFTVVLDTEPSADVTIALMSSDESEGRVLPVSVTFSPTTWDIPQTITVTGQDDLLDDGDINFLARLLPVASSDPGYDGLDASDVEILNVDNDSTPELDLNGGESGIDFEAEFVSSGGPVPIVALSLMITDSNATQLASATVTISDPLPGDVLAVNTAGTAINAQFSNGVLALAGTDTLSNYEQVLRSTTFNSFASHSAGSMIDIAFTVNNGQLSSSTAHTLVSVSALGSSTVLARQLFYNNSFYDTDSPLNPAQNDNTAIATDKEALLPGGIATFANYSTYDKGLNGIFIDVANLSGIPTVADFEFLVGGVGVFDGGPATWTEVPPNPISPTVEPGAGVNGSDRVKLIWADGEAVKNNWLRITMLDTVNTGLSAPDIFYFGSSVGDTGTSNLPNAAVVDVNDEFAIRSNPRDFLNRAPVDDPYDVNRDSLVDVVDEFVPRSHATNFLTGLSLFTAPPGTTAPVEQLSLPGTGQDAVEQAIVAPPGASAITDPTTNVDRSMQVHNKPADQLGGEVLEQPTKMAVVLESREKARPTSLDGFEFGGALATVSLVAQIGAAELSQAEQPLDLQPGLKHAVQDLSQGRSDAQGIAAKLYEDHEDVASYALPSPASNRLSFGLARSFANQRHTAREFVLGELSPQGEHFAATGSSVAIETSVAQDAATSWASSTRSHRPSRALQLAEASRSADSIFELWDDTELWKAEEARLFDWAQPKEKPAAHAKGRR